MFASSEGLPQFKLGHESNRPLANASLTEAIEASAQPDFVNLWPAVEFGLPGRTTPVIYGRIYEAGLTEAAGAAPNIVAQLGYGPSGSDPSISSDWVWVDASYSMQLGDEDRYAAAFIAPDEVGTFAYTFRFAIDDGVNPLSFTYADLDGNGTNAGLGFDSGQLGLLNITPEYVGTSGVDIFTATSSEEWTISGLGGDDVLSGAGGWDSISGGEGNDHLIGGDGDDHLRGGDGNDILEGGAGADAMEGGAGDDLFIVNYEIEEIVGTGHEGYDTILLDPDPAQLVFNYVLPNVAVEVVTTRLEGTQRINITGNNLANILIGNSGENRLSGGNGNDHLIGNGGDDVLVGGAGADILEGGTGDDEYGGENSETIIEKPGEGYDSIRVATNYFLAAGVEIELLSVPFISTTAVNVTGNEFGQRITGNFGVNRLYGEAGDDELFGLRGDDILHGGTGSDWLDGDEGADKLHGDAGNDIYVVDTASDRVFEAVSEGNDLVYASASFNTRVGVEVEVLRAIDATSTAAIDLGGNEFSQTLIGNAGANVLHGRGGSDSLNGHGGNDTLDGGTGSDKLYGGAGDDKYRVDTASDRVIEVAGAGRDIVFASANYGLRSGTEIEVLRTSNDAATTSINLSGNEFAQIIVGNAGANVINGGGGDDTLIGRGGADRFVFSHLGGTDHVPDLETGVDTIDLSALDANSVAAGDQAFAFIGDNTFGGVAGQLRTYISDGKRYVAGDVNGDGVADFTIDFGTSTVGSLDFIL